MNEKELGSIQELIERKLLMAEVMGGLTSSEKKFIDLWNYTKQLKTSNAIIQEKYKIVDEINQKYKEVIDKLKEWINIVQQNKDNKHLEPFISTDELDELLDILKEVE